MLGSCHSDSGSRIRCRSSPRIEFEPGESTALDLVVNTHGPESHQWIGSVASINGPMYEAHDPAAPAAAQRAALRHQVVSQL